MMSFVIESGKPADGLPTPDAANASGVALSLTRVAWLGDAADDGSLTPGVSLHVPPGQSVALYGEPAGDAVELLDIVAGLHEPLSGKVTVDEIAVDRLSGQELDRYRAGLGLISARFPLVPSSSVIDNVLAAPPGGVGVDDATRERAEQLLAITGTARLAGPVGDLPAEQQWQVLIARALQTSPRLVLAEDPAPGLGPRAAAAILDLLTDVHAQFGFTLLLTVGRLVTASCCQRLVRLAGGAIIEDVLIGGDDPWTRDRVDRIG
jgi:putative ABC transport system ATP-binding protein